MLFDLIHIVKLGVRHAFQCNTHKKPRCKTFVLDHKTENQIKREVSMIILVKIHSKTGPQSS